MNIGSLFSGIGGLDLGLERAGLGTTVWQVEADPYCRAVLAKHWPAAVRHDDVRTVGAANLAPVDVICGGFPCQDISLAGKGAGLDGARSGLWFEYLRIVQEVRPRVVIIENVAALRTRGLAVVLSGLASAGYRAEWALAAARDVGAPHRRQRLFVVAVADASIEPEREPADETDTVTVGRGARLAPGGNGEPVADARGARRREVTGSAPRDEGAHEGRSASHDHVADGDGESGGSGTLADAPERGLRRGRASGASGLDARGGEDVAHGIRDGRRGVENGAGGDDVHGAKAGRQEGADRLADGHEVLAHGHGHGRARVAERDLGADRSGLEAPLRHDAHGRDAGLADTDDARFQGHGRPVEGERAPGSASGPGAARRAGAGPRQHRPAEPGLGRGSDGLSRWLDRVASRGDRWPEPPGPTQADWEPPRTAVGVHKRANRLKALGNAVVPQVAEAVGLWAIEILTGRT